MSNEKQQVSNPLTLVMNIKSPEDALAVQKLLLDVEETGVINQAMMNIGTVHFARFVFLSPLELAVITSYDGDFELYIKDFTQYLGDVFDQLLAHMKDTAGVTPVQSNLKAFLKYIETNDRSRVNGQLQSLFSAYPTLTVKDIWELQLNSQ